MNNVQEKQTLEKIVELMENWLGESAGEVEFSSQKDGFCIDLIQKIKNWTFLFEYKNSSAIPPVFMAIESLNKYAGKLGGKTIPVVAVPFMSEGGRRLCEEHKVSWLDLSGNADIKALGLRIRIEGKPNKFRAAGRPKDFFAPKSARITRHLLLDPAKYLTQRELTNETRLDEGLVSRVVREMEKSDLLVRNSTGGVKPRDPGILLDAWRERYDFSKHRIIKGFVAERTSDAILSKLTGVFEKHNTHYALTGLCAAWILSRFATFRTSTVYLREMPSEKLFSQMNFRQEEKGSNVWLVVPNDEDVFEGASARHGVTCAHPVQVYLDLKAHPERAKEAAQALREEYLNWKTNAE